MKKFFLSRSFLCAAVLSVLGAACHDAHSSSTAQETAGATPVSTDWSVVVKRNITATDCAAELERAEGVQVRAVFDSFGLVLVSSPSVDPLKSIGCIAAASRDDGVAIPEDPVWMGIAIVGEGFDPHACAASIGSAGAQGIMTLPISGLVTFQIPVERMGELRDLECVRVLEMDQVMGTNGIAGITN